LVADLRCRPRLVGYLIFLGLQVQFLGFAFLRQKQEPAEKWSTPAAGIVGFASLAFALFLLSFDQLANRPPFLFSFTFLADLGLLALALLRPNPARIAGPASAVVFLILSVWTGENLRHEFLWWALGAYLLFALLHAGFSVWPKRAEAPPTPAATRWQSYIPVLALALLFLCVWRGETSFAVWACVLLINVIAVAMAAASRSVVALVLALFATLITAGLWIVTAPPLRESVVGILIVVAGFGVFFSTASTFLARRLGIGAGDQRRNVPAIAAAMPFVLLLMLIAKLPIGAPTAVFAVALLLAVVLLGLGIVSGTSWIAAVALAFTWAVERQWHSLHFENAHALLALGWYVAFALLFIAYPFFGRTPVVSSSMDGTAAVPPRERALPWAIGALSGVLHFTLIYELVSAAYPQLRNGLLPALFVLPYAFGVLHLIRNRGVVPASGDARLAWQGGAALLFVSLIFPIQFEREWITLGWALEGFALLVLFRFVPHGGLRLVGRGVALRGIRPARVESGGVRVPSARGSADLELVSLCVWHHGVVPLRGCPGGAAVPRHAARACHPAGALCAWHRVDVPAPEHRDRRLFLDRADDDLLVLGQLRTRHDVFDRVGALRARAAAHRHAPKDKMGAVCRPRVVTRDAREIVPARLR
jgi:hypothetical protein